MADAAESQQNVVPEHTNDVKNGDSENRLQSLIAQATAKYSIKDYSAAAELYSRGTELQAEMNGEMSPKNADLLYAFGRCLYHVAVSNSDVLGSKVAGEKETSERSKSKKVNGRSSANEAASGEQSVADEVVAKLVQGKDGVKEADRAARVESKPYFQFTGDENFDDSDEDAEGLEDGAEDDEASEEDDDFSNAYEVLDLARILLQRRLEGMAASEGKGKSLGDSEDVKRLKERLADTHDLQAEISLEGERFPNAVVDLKAALELKQELFSQDSSLIAEAHYKLSLALEFSSVTQQKDENEEVDATQQAHVDEEMREEAAKEMEAAIASCRARILKEEEALTAKSSTNGESAKSRVTMESIADVKEIVKDMEQRLVELRQPPVSINDPTSTGSIDGSNPLSGILGSILGETAEAQKSRIEEASKSANDLTNLVKRKKPTNGDKQDTPKQKSNGKRKVEFADEVEEVGTGKKAKIEDADER